jgi:hypothetical protein
MCIYKHSKKEVEDIGWRSLKKLTLAVFGDENQVWSNLDMMIGKKLRLKTKIEEYNGFSNARVKTYLPLASNGITDPQPRFGQLNVAANMPPAQRTAPAVQQRRETAPAVTTPDQEDTPF